jgi:peptide/nickel transport system substrate-binding protein
VNNMRRSKRLVVLAASLSLIALAACGDDDDGGSAATTAPAGTNASETSAGTETTTASSGTEAPSGADTGSTNPGGAAPTGETAMTLTIDLNPDAVWEDGSPITWEDLQCTWQAMLNTPGSVFTAGYDQITGVEKGTSDKQAVVNFKTVYGPYKNLFSSPNGPVIKKAAVEDCMDISGDFSTEMPISGRAVKLQSYSEGQSVFVPNEKYWGDDKMVTDQVVFVPQTDTDTEIASLKSGQVDYAYPQISAALGASLSSDPNIKIDVQGGGDYESIYFQQKTGPFADPDFRKAFSLSIDRDALFAQIYEPIFESAGAKGQLLNCGPIVEGPYCPTGLYQKTYDPAAAEKTLTDAGWEKNGEGMWAKDGKVPTVRWMVNSGNSRRENTQAYLIPLLKQAGFNVVADNCNNDCMFQQRVPTLDYDLSMYINTAPPDPTYLTTNWSCDQVPTEENGNKGGNTTGYCNEEATKALHDADAEADEAARKELITKALTLIEQDYGVLPLVTYPKTGVINTSKIGGPVEADTANFRPFQNFHQWTDVDKDGKVVIGAEQWPTCLNPTTECATSSWYLYTISNPLLPAVWDTTNKQEFQITNLVASEPVVKVL